MVVPLVANDALPTLGTFAFWYWKVAIGVDWLTGTNPTDAHFQRALSFFTRAAYAALAALASGKASTAPESPGEVADPPGGTNVTSLAVVIPVTDSGVSVHDDAFVAGSENAMKVRASLGWVYPGGRSAVVSRPGVVAGAVAGVVVAVWAPAAIALVTSASATTPAKIAIGARRERVIAERYTI
jgi:hypothetical protein